MNTKTMGLRALCALMACAAVFSLAAAATGADYPQKGRPIIIIVPNAPGGINDMTARLVAPVMEKELGTPVQVVNKPGAATLLGL
ncbi:MAG: tripartite tricarboxylate transporter substrate binding protein, partial [Candidatus Methylomirabilota bacterium]